MQILFCIDKARTRSFTEVALNSVLEENAASAIDFEWEFYFPNKNIYEQCICCFPIISSAVQSRHFAYCSAVRTLHSVRKQTRVRFLNSCPEWGSLTIHYDYYKFKMQCVLCTLCANKQESGF